MNSSVKYEMGTAKQSVVPDHGQRTSILVAAFTFASVLALGLSGCRKERTNSAKAAPSAVASAKPTPSVRPGSMIPPKPVAQQWKVPTGVTLPIFVGEGIGPIRFGATATTVERLMGISCKPKTPTLCRMSDRGVNFFFDANGALERIYISLEDRKDPTAPEHVFGPFNGVFSAKAAFGMVPGAIIEELGKPDRIVPAGPNPNETKEEHHYPSMVLEYDLAKTGKLVLGGVTLKPKPGTVLPKPKVAAPADSGR